MSEEFDESIDLERRSLILNSGVGLGAISLLELFGGTALAQQAAPSADVGEEPIDQIVVGDGSAIEELACLSRD